MGKVITGIAAFVGILAIAVVIGLLFAWPLMWLINAVFAPSVLVAVFGTSQISFWQGLWAVNHLWSAFPVTR